MKEYNIKLFLLFLVFIFLINIATSQDLAPVRQQRIKYGPSLYLLEVNSNPEEIQPGGSAVITLRIQNVAPHPLRDIIIDFDLPSQFAPEETTKQKIRFLNSSDMLSINFTLVALPNAQEGIYKLPLKISYTDEIGNEYKENNTISIKISAEPKIFAELSSSEIYKENLLGKVDIKIANIGIGNIKFLIAQILPSNEYEIIGSSSSYIGALDSDEYETVDFKLEVKEGTKSANLLLKFSYSDANNKEYIDTVEIPLNIITAREAGIKQNKNSLLILVVIAVLILYIAYRQYRKRQKRK